MGVYETLIRNKILMLIESAKRGGEVRGQGVGGGGTSTWKEPLLAPFITCDLEGADAVVVVATRLLELGVEILADLDVLEHARQLVHVVSRHTHLLQCTNTRLQQKLQDEIS